MNGQLSLLNDWFESGQEAGWIDTYEREAIRFLEKEYGALNEPIRQCTVFLSLFIKAGHTCLPLNKSSNEWIQLLGLDVEDESPFSADPVRLSDIKSSPVVGTRTERKPLILSGKRLSFRRYYIYEDIVRQWIKKKTSNHLTTDISDISVQSLNELFPENADGIHWQKVAAALSLIKPFLIISGGPGTGKTTTIARILALHQRLSENRLNIALAAPTGKAAGRMGEALNKQLDNLGLSSDEKKHFPSEAKTVHRLLTGTESESLLPPMEKKLLRQDLIIIDEASMMDLSLIYRLVTHLSEHTKLILLGDRDQLASVEAGAVFADLCQKIQNGFLPDTVQLLQALGIQENLPVQQETEISDSIVYLTKSYRFDPTSGVGQLSDIVRSKNKDGKDIRSVFGSFSDINHVEFNYSKEDIEFVSNDLMDKVRKCSNLQDPDALLTYWKESIWLMVHRRGVTGTERLNRLVEEQLAARRILGMDDGWYHGRPIIITQNDYSLGVFNGDLGVTVKEDGMIWVYVETGSDIKRFNPQRINHYEPAYFLTVHKSQGSEFEQVNLLLPQMDSPILTRELIYTAITRARKRFSLYGDLQLFEKGLRRESLRFTGLKEMLFTE